MTVAADPGHGDPGHPPGAAAPRAGRPGRRSRPPEGRPERRRRSRNAAPAAAAALAGLLALAAVATAEWQGWPFLREPLRRAAERAAGAPVALDDGFSLRLFGRPHLRVGRLVVGAAPGGPSAPHLAAGRDVTLAWRWGDAWRWWRGERLHLARLTASTLDVRLLRDAQGRATWAIGRPASEAGGAPRDRDAGTPAGPEVDWLGVAEGRIRIDDVPTRTALDIALDGDGAPGTTEAGRWRAAITGRWRDLPMDLRLQADAPVPLLLDDPDAQAPTPVRLAGRIGDGRIAFDGKAGALLGPRRLDGELRLSGPSLAGVFGPAGLAVPTTPPFDLAGRLAHADGRWRLAVREAAIGRSRLGGEFAYDTTASPPRLVGRLTGARLGLADLGPAVGAPTSPGRPGTDARGRTAAGRVLPQRRLDLPALDRMQADVQVSVDELDFGRPGVAPWRPVRGRLTLADRVLDLRDLELGAAGGRIAGTARIDAQPTVPRWSARLQVAGLAVEQWLPGLRSPARADRDSPAARAAARPPVVTGRIEGGFELAGSGRSTAEVLGSLDGQGALRLRDGTLSHLATEAVGLDLAQALGVVVKGDEPLPLRCARLDVAARDGRIEIRRAVVENRDSTLRVAGHVDLGDESMALLARARPKDFSPLSLRVPVTVRGTLADPQVGVQAGALGGRVLGAIALGATLGPLAALLPLVDPGERAEGDPCAGPAPGATAGSGTAAGPRGR